MSSRRMKSIAWHAVNMSPGHVFRVPSRRSKGAYISSRQKQDERSRLLSDGKSQLGIPRGFMPVYVGPEQRRFVIPTRYLSVPYFRVVMEKTAEELGFEQEGGLRILCDEQDFEQLIASCSAACSL